MAFGVAYAGLIHDTHGWLALTPWFILAGIGIGIGCVETAEHAAVAAYAPAEIRGSAFGLLAAVQSFGNFAASGIAGLLWTAAGPSWAFAYLTGWMILAAVLLTRVPPRPTPSMTRLGADRG
jgi:MFS family permease